MATADLARQFTERFVKEDIPGLLELFTEDAHYHDVFYGHFTGHEGLRGMFEIFFREARDYRWDLTNVIATETAIAAEAEFGFTMKSNGNRAGFPMVSIFEIAGGKIAGYREYFDFGRALLQSGVDPAAVGKIIQRRIERGD